MDFRFTEEQERLRKEFEEFYEEAMKEAPEDWEGGLNASFNSEQGIAFYHKMARKLGEKGWLAWTWPEEYGGQGLTLIEKLIFSEVTGYYGAPGVDVFGVEMLGPTLLMFGTEEQKREHLPYIARGERLWCQGWSEPNAGSDLASLTTRAVESGDDYIINGQKIWTSGAHVADWMFMLARTDPELPRHRGLSYFIFDMKTPGVTVRPLYEMGGWHIYNEVFFDDVRVPRTNMVGEKNRGWYCTLATMDFERAAVGNRIGETRRIHEELVNFCRETHSDGESLVNNPLVRSRLAQLAIEVEAGRMMSYRVAWLYSKGQLVTTEASAAKIFGSELMMRLAYTGMQLLGLYGQLKAGSKWAALHGRFEAMYNHSVEDLLAGGSSEIQRNIIAWRGLELPRE